MYLFIISIFSLLILNKPDNERDSVFRVLIDLRCLSDCLQDYARL